MLPRLYPAALALAALTLAGCGQTVEAPTEIVRFPCPDRLVTNDKAKRPVPPRWGVGPTVEAQKYFVLAEKYMDDLERLGQKRVDQVTECHERAKRDGG